MVPEIIRETAWIGDEWLIGKVKGVVLTFHGLGGGLKYIPTTEELECGRHGGLVVHPYYGPCGWMNRQARAMVDELVDAIYTKYRLSDRTPLICTGGSMGGQGSLLYTRYAKRPVCACLARCPVCDTKFSFHERPDVPPTIHHAFSGYTEDMEVILAEHSPLCQVAAMPDIPYRIIAGAKDKAVSKKHHSDKMVAAMRKRKLNVEYVEVAEMGHGEPLPLAVLQGNIEFVLAAMKRKQE